MSKLHIPAINSENLERINPLLLPLPWLVVAILVIVFASIKFSSKEDNNAPPPTAIKIFPQTYLTDVEVHQYDQNGALHYQMNAPLIRRFQVEANPSAKDYSLFQSPKFILVNDPQKPSWTVTAQEGRLDTNDIWFTLSNDVMAHQSSLKQGEITLNTPELRLNTQEQFAETSKAVTMRAAKSEITATGLRADMTREHIELLSNVKGTYEP